MSLAEKHINLLNETIQMCIKDHEKLSQMVSDIDSEINKIYHEIEIGKYSASEGYKKLKELQTALRKRRVIKHEFTKFSQIKSILQPTGFIPAINKVLKAVDKSTTKNESYTDGWGISFEEMLNNT